MILSQEAGAFGNNIEKKPQKPRPKLKKRVYCIHKFICSAYISMEKYLLCLRSNASGSFFANMY